MWNKLEMEAQHWVGSSLPIFYQSPKWAMERCRVWLAPGGRLNLPTQNEHARYKASDPAR